MFNGLIDKIIRIISPLKVHPLASKFIHHNEMVFQDSKCSKLRKSVVLFEFNGMHSAHIALSYLINGLALNSQSKIQTYITKPHRNFLQRIIFKIKTRVGRNAFGIYKSFGVTEFLEIGISNLQKKRALGIYTEALGRLNTKRDIEELTLNGVWVGDLIYDSFLMTYKKSTVDMNSGEFQHFLLESIEIFVFWEDYLRDNDVRAINVSHCVYNLAMPLRIAVQWKIPVFQTNITHVYRLNSKNLFAYSDFFNFREIFATLSPEVQNKGIAEAQLRIARRFAGEVGVDMAYSTKSAYSGTHYSRLLRQSSRKKVLIATHCFFDSPHSYGNNIFPDFYEWLDFLGKLTLETDYDWYIKTHPDYLPGTKEIIESFVIKYPKFTLLPADASHHQIIAEGIDFALTVYGTIAFEYAALGIPVINASQNNPHIAYDFNLHAKDVEDYRRMLIGLDSLEFTIDKQQVYEYYFMRHIYNNENLFFDNYDAIIDKLGGYSKQFTPAIYEEWLEEWSPEKHRAIVEAVKYFIHSSDFRMDRTHFNRNFTTEPFESNA
jgi:hypothetical protein